MEGINLLGKIASCSWTDLYFHEYIRWKFYQSRIEKGRKKSVKRVRYCCVLVCLLYIGGVHMNEIQTTNNILRSIYRSRPIWGESARYFARALR